jgi:hypothetical protein
VNQHLPNYLASQSLDGLRGLMAELSIKKGGTVTFFSVYHDGKQHIAWYHEEAQVMLARLKQEAKKE